MERIRMDRVNAILKHKTYRKYYDQIEKIEKDRIFCRHQMPHLLDVARIAYITNLERNLGYDREVIYAAAILHDIGKSFQYEERIPHEIAGEKVASEILDTLPEGLAFSAEERRLILAAVREHRKKKDGAEPIAALFYDSDKRSRTCFSCPAEKECNCKEIII